MSGKDVKTAKKTDEKNKDLHKMQELLRLIPSPSRLLENVSNESELLDKLNTLTKQEGHLASKLLSYILATNRSTIRKLKESELVEGIPSPDLFEQYVLIA